VTLPPAPPTNTAGSDYNFASGGWTLFNTSGVLTLAQEGDAPATAEGVVDLSGISARYIGLEILTNWGTTMARVGLAEVAFTVPDDPNLPFANAGSDWVTWSGEKVKLNSTVTNNDLQVPQRDISILWTTEILVSDPNDANEVTVVFDPAVNPGDPNTSEVVDPNVTITVTDPNIPRPVIVELTLTATLGSEYPVSDSVRINVYDDNCAAAIGKGEVIDPGDFDADCDTDLIDLREMIDVWLDSYSLTEPAVKP
jgi:hypothetical protein